MQQRPGLALEVGGVWSTAQDSRALQEQKATDRVEAREAEMGRAEDVLSTELRRSALEALLTEAEPGLDLAALQVQFSSPASEEEDAEPVLDVTAYSAALFERFVATQSVSAEKLITLANARANAVLALLQGEGEGPTLNATLTQPAEAEDVTNEGIVLELAVNVDETADE